LARRLLFASIHGWSGFVVASSTALYAHTDTRDSEPDEFSDHSTGYSGESLEGQSSAG
jgi:hypothetical protein